MNELSIITQLPDLKQIGIFKQNIKAELLDGGNYNLLNIWHYFKAGARLFKELSDDEDIRKAILNEAEKQGSKSFEMNGVKFSIKEAGTKYDYSGCNDSEYNLLTEKFNQLSELKKEREKFLQGITTKTEIYGSDGAQILPPIKTSQTIVEVKL
jgi:hypothetical protein